jgi:hypothetical protein
MTFFDFFHKAIDWTLMGVLQDKIHEDKIWKLEAKGCKNYEMKNELLRKENINSVIRIT